MTETLIRNCYDSPLGDMDLVLRDDTLVYLDFAGNPERLATLLGRRYPGFRLTESRESTRFHAALDDYFAGVADPFDGLPVETGGTDFQRSVWRELRRIPSGTTLDYATLAERAGRPAAVRAAASSNARNPVSIVIPCHRVIGRDGSLRGYAGGEGRKRWLIEHERRWAEARAAA